MIRINAETPIETLLEIKKGDFITDGFSKTGIVEFLEKEDRDVYQEFRFTLTTGSIIYIRI